MSEFNSRIEAQRRIVQIVNSAAWSEELFGLSSKAIQRWTVANHVDPAEEVVPLIKAAAAELFFLADQSQDQISAEYVSAAQRVSEIASTLELQMRRLRS